MVLLSIAKLQNLKAIHNRCRRYTTPTYVVINRKTTKFESNSQRRNQRTKLRWSCYQSQNYKIWKQFTTQFKKFCMVYWLLSIAKLQNLKAIHNCSKYAISLGLVVINRKTTKFESNSQQRNIVAIESICCYQSQNYKIWKQFTTYQKGLKNRLLLLSIAKLQNLKAIHNGCCAVEKSMVVVINRKTTKFESNSQRFLAGSLHISCCYQSQNYKIWKQFTT